MDIMIYTEGQEPNEVARVLTGSRGYGYATEESDYDIKTIYYIPTRDFLKTNSVRTKDLNKEQVFSFLPDGKELDIAGWEIGKFLGMCANGNPNALDVLFADPDCILRLDNQIKEVFDNKKRFLSKKVVGTYSSFAENQKKECQKAPNVAKALKTSIHYARCMFSAYNLVTTGAFTIKVPDWFVFMAKTGKAEYVRDTVIKDFISKGDEYLEDIKRIGEDHLPDSPDMEWIDNWLISFRLSRNVG